MAGRRSNYPRESIEEESVEVFKPWQWIVLFFVANMTSILRIWLPTLKWSYIAYATTFYSIHAVSATLIVVCGALFGGGSLARVVRDRWREPSRYPSLLILFCVLLPIVCELLRDFVFQLGSTRYPPTVSHYVQHHSFAIWPTLAIVAHLAHSISAIYLNLLIIALPKSIERLMVYATYCAGSIFLITSGIYIESFIFPYASMNVLMGSSLVLYIFKYAFGSVFSAVVLWILDRTEFPSFRPLGIYGLMVVFANIFLRFEISWFGFVINIVGLALIAIVAIVRSPGNLALPWKEGVEVLQN